MKREGRQHGMVRTYPILSTLLNPRPRRRNLNEITSPPTAGIFNKVAGKPTNHSKFTGKCGRPMCRQCHIHPAGKSKEKVKGCHKIRSSLVPNLKFSGFSSATGILEYLGNEDYRDRICDLDNDDYDDDDVNFDVEGEKSVEIGGIEVNDNGVNDVVDDDGMSFCEVGFVWETVEGDESWCLVKEL